MIYLYRADDGSELDVELPMSEAPDIGAERTHQGKTYKRVISLARPLVRKDCLVVSHSQCRNTPDHDGEFTRDGKPVFTSHKEINEYSARASDRGDSTVEYDTWSGIRELG